MKYYIIIILWLIGSFSDVKKYFKSYRSSPTVHIIQPDQWDTFHKKREKIRIVVIIDVFRACTTAAYVLNHNPETYILASKSYIIERLASNFENPLLIGSVQLSV
ncbi:2-phosphosulfolactate phosphatase [Candidatus Cardinium hertigii]|uniref:2-phosphosulfolactate phosphatase n=1 Tax=Candidatus Cardinium hertigii TaxID=247481 RepID=UPI003D7E3945